MTARTRSWKPGWRRPTGWNPELVGKPGYPKTSEAWEAKREKSRQHARKLHERGGFARPKGVPDGWSGRHAELAATRQQSVEAARRAVSVMQSRGDLDGEDPRAAEALAFLASVILDCAASSTDRLAASRTFLTFTMPRPAMRGVVSVVSAEDFLAELLGRV